MARYFNSSNLQYLNRDGAINITGFPLTLSAWFYPFDITTNSAILGFNSSTKTVNNICLIYALGAVAGDPVAAYVAGGASEQRVDSTTGFTANTWHHIAGVFPSTTSRTIYLDAGSSNTGTTSVSPTFSDVNRLCIGTWYSDVSNAYMLYANGLIAEAAIWSTNLDFMEIKALSNGLIPTAIRPQSLLAYWPLGGHHGQYDFDFWKNRYDLTAYNSPIWTDHPRIIYQSGSRNNFTSFPDYTTLLDVIHPTNYYTIDSNYPFLSVRNNREMLLFSSTVQQTACFSRIMPRTYTGNGCHVYLYVAASTDVASTQNATFSFDVAFERVGNRVQPIDSNNFSSNKNRYYEQVPEICGYIKCIKIPFTASQMSSIQAGELYTLRVQRSVAFDDATGTAELYAVEVRNV